MEASQKEAAKPEPESRTAVSFATGRGTVDTDLFLLHKLEAGTRIEGPALILDKTQTLRHQRSFMLAADYGRDEVLKLLWTRGMPQDMLDAALYNAADHEHEDTVKLLLDYGADPDAEGAEYVFFA